MARVWFYEEWVLLPNQGSGAARLPRAIFLEFHNNMVGPGSFANDFAIWTAYCYNAHVPRGFARFAGL